MKAIVPTALLLFLACAVSAGGEVNFSKLVNPFTGTDGHGHTFPGATLPFGMVQLSPDTRVEGWDACAGYHYSDTAILGFSHTHLSGTGIADYGDILVRPSIGVPHAPLRFSHRHEEASPGYYRVAFTGMDLTAEMTCTERVGVHRYTFPTTDSAMLTFDLHHGLGPDRVIASSVKIVSDREIEGMRRSAGWAKDQLIYFVARFSVPFTDHTISGDSTGLNDSTELSGVNVVARLRFKTSSRTPLIVKVALSSTGTEGARKNLGKEAPSWDFNRIRKNAASVWKRELGKIEVSGENHDRHETFYTALYHALLTPNLYSDCDGKYRGMDGAVKTGDNFRMYTVFSLWDTFRAEHPLLTILDRGRSSDFVRSLLAKYDESGFLPVWELASNETWTMIGYHAVPVIVDAYMKGIRGFDAEHALQAMIHSAMADQYGLADYRTFGYLPGDKEGESVSKTLEYAYDDWCIAQFAKSLGHDDVYRQFLKRASSYENIFDPSTGFMRAKVNGRWVEPFDPTAVTVHYTEANPWQYSFFVPHDVAGLIESLGGKEKFIRKLDSLFYTTSRLSGRQQDDISGLVGQYAQGNEPSHHIAYLYDMAGAPWKTAAIVRRICDSLYSAKPDGLCGNDDCGQMSAWYVMSAIGLYEICPGDPRYSLTAPLFDSVTIHLENGRSFSIFTSGRRRGGSSIVKATLNGVVSGRSSISHETLTEGGKLLLTLGEGASSAWGTAADDNRPTALPERIVPVPYYASNSGTFSDSAIIEIKSPVAGMNIHYTIDGSEPTVSSPIYGQPIVLHESGKVRSFSIAGDGRMSEVATAEFKKHRKIGTIVLNTKYSAQYTGGGDEALIDGVEGGPNFRLGAWQGYEGNDLEAVLDLGTSDSIASLSLGCLQDADSWIFLPRYVDFSFSEDGKNFSGAIRIENKKSLHDAEPAVVRFDRQTPGMKARYIKVIAKNVGICPPWHRGAGGKAWLFADELNVEVR